MRWYKHIAKAHRDTKVKKLVNEYGADGYAIYFYCLELIADNLEHDNITFELEDDAELVGQYLKIDTLRVERIMKYCVHLDLFGVTSAGKITCLKMAKFLDERFTRNPVLKKMIKNEKMVDIKNQLSEDKQRQVEDMSRETILDQNSIDYLNKESLPAKKKPGKKQKALVFSEDFLAIWAICPRKEGKDQAYKNYLNLLDAGVSARVLHDTMAAYAAEIKREKRTDYLYKPSNFYGELAYWKDYVAKAEEAQEKAAAEERAREETKAEQEQYARFSAWCVKKYGDMDGPNWPADFGEEKELAEFAAFEAGEK